MDALERALAVELGGPLVRGVGEGVSSPWWATPPVSFGMLGDSITRNQYTPSTAWSAQVGTVLNWTGRAFGLWATQLSGRKAWANINAFEGYSGQRTDEILAGMLPSSATFTIGVTGNTATVPNGVRACRPNYCFVMAGTNDLSQSVSQATVVANLRAIWAALRAAGVEPIALSLLPRDAPATGQATVPTWNAAIAAAAASDGVHFIDIYTTCDNGSGGFKTGYTWINGAPDPLGLHPGNEGSQAIAAVIAADLATWLPAHTQTPYVDSASTVVISNGTLTQSRPSFSSVNAGLFPTVTAWSTARLDSGGTSTAAVSAVSPAQIGNALVITVPTPSGSDMYCDRNGGTNITVVPGKKYALMARLEFIATDKGDTAGFGIQGPASAATLFTMFTQNNSVASTATGASMTARDVYHEFVVPPGLTTLRWWIQATGKLGGTGCTLKVAQMALREL